MGFSTAEKPKRLGRGEGASGDVVSAWVSDARYRILRSETSDCMWSGGGDVSPAEPSAFVGAYVVLYESVYGCRPEIDRGAALGITRRWLQRFDGDLELAFDCLAWAMSYEVVLRDWVTSSGQEWVPSGIAAAMSGARYEKWMAETGGGE